MQKQTSLTYGEAIRTPGTKLYEAAQQQRRELAERLAMTPEEREAYWREVMDGRS